MSEVRTVTIGDETHRIPRFKGLKASLAGALLSRVSTEVPQLQDEVAEYRKQFREKNSILITPAMAKLPRFEGLGLTNEDFETAGGNIEFPEEPTGQAIVIHVFPRLFELARKELQRFLALIVIPNSELERADDADDIEGALDKLGKQLIRRGDIDELLQLLVVGSEVFKEQMASKRESLGKLPIPMLQQLLEAMDQPESAGPGQNTPIPTETSPSPHMNSVSSSSIDSPNGTTGQEETSSTASLG